MTLAIVTREEWGAQPARCTTGEPSVLETWLHHTVGYSGGGAGYMRQMQAQHLADLGGSPGCDIAYNFVIDPADLTVYEGRGWGVRPGAQRSHNARTWALAIMGDYSNRMASLPLEETIVELLRLGHRLGYLPLELTGGHRQAPGQSTTCPGRLTENVPRINRKLTIGDPIMSDLIPPPDWAVPATQWHIDRGLYKATTYKRDDGTVPDPFKPRHVVETFAYHRQTVYRYDLARLLVDDLGDVVDERPTITLELVGKVL